MKNYDLNEFDVRLFKNTEYSLIPVGNEFYTRRPRLTSYGEDDTLPFKKVASFKNNKGGWTNAVSKLGQESFIAYDQKVLVLEKK